MSEAATPHVTLHCAPEPWLLARARPLADALSATLNETASLADTDSADLFVVAGDSPTFANDKTYVRAAVLRRDDPREALVTRDGGALPDVAASKTATLMVWASSTRVQVALRARDVSVLPAPNVDEALAAVANGEATAVVAPIPVLRAHSRSTPQLVARPLEHGEILHPIASGLVSVFCRRDDAQSRKMLAPFDDAAARQALTAERELLFHVTGDDPATPFAVAGHAETRLTAAGDERLVLLGLLSTSTGAGPYRASHEVGSADATMLGRAMAATLLAQHQQVLDRRHEHSHHDAQTGT